MDRAKAGVCAGCGGDISLDKNFCPLCGRPVQPLTTSSQAAVGTPWAQGQSAAAPSATPAQVPAAPTASPPATPAPWPPASPSGAPARSRGRFLSSRRGRAAIALAAVLVLVVGGLGIAVFLHGGSSPSSLADTPMVAATTVDVPFDHSEQLVTSAKGGTVALEGASVAVLPNALRSDATLQLKVTQTPFHQQTGQPPSGSSGYAYAAGPAVDFGPDGMSFASPVTVSVPYYPSLLRAGETEDSIHPAYWNGKTWIVLDGTVDKKARTVSVALKGFNGVSLVAVGILGAVIVGTGVVIYNKLTASDAIADGKASQWITVNDTSVLSAAGSATLGGVKLSDQKAFVAYLESGDRATQHLVVTGRDAALHSPKWTEEGKVGWQKPATYLDKSGMVGDCTDSSNFETSILRVLGYPAKAVFGYQFDTDHPHEWTEVLIHGKLYLMDEWGSIQPLAASLENLRLIRPEPGDPRYRSMWDEKSQEPYDPEWWRAAVSVDPKQIADYSKPVNLDITVNHIPTFVESFTTVIDWGDGRSIDKVKSTVDDTRRIVVKPPTHSFNDTPKNPITISFVNGDGRDLIEWGVFTILPETDVKASVSPKSIDDPTAIPKLDVSLTGIPSSVKTFKIAVDWGDGSSPQILDGRKPDASGNYQTTIGKPVAFAKSGKDVKQVVVTFQDSTGRTLTNWPRIVIPVNQPAAVPTYASIDLELWMGHCQNCVDFRPGKPFKLVKNSPTSYSGDAMEMHEAGIASLDLKIGNSGRTITALSIVYAADPSDFLTLTNIPITATVTDPADNKQVSEYALGGWSTIMPHLKWQMLETIANGSKKIATQAEWREDPSSAGQEYLKIFLKQP